MVKRIRLIWFCQNDIDEPNQILTIAQLVNIWLQSLEAYAIRREALSLKENYLESRAQYTIKSVTDAIFDITSEKVSHKIQYH